MVGSFSGGVELWDIESGEKAFTLSRNNRLTTAPQPTGKSIPPAIILPGTLMAVLVMAA